eukprot:6213937-Pleurochrysis_carterae.AAC.3
MPQCFYSHSVARDRAQPNAEKCCIVQDFISIVGSALRPYYSLTTRIRVQERSHIAAGRTCLAPTLRTQLLDGLL